jgi:ribonucleoside-diphosphate reductase alpha chain
MLRTKLIDPPGAEPVLSENAVTVLRSRYLIKDEGGNVIETPGQLFSRVARLIAENEANYGAAKQKVDKWHKAYYELMASLRFLPNSPTLMNAYRPQGMLSACFVLPIEDSIEEIFESVKHTALIQRAGGGTGFSFDHLRPTGDRVASSGGTTSGPISFWRVFSEATNAIQQGAFRRGANMGMMNVEHPDILKFIHAKQNLSAFTNFNISVKVTDEWMRTLKKNPRKLHVVRNPRTGVEYLLPRRLDINTYSIDQLVPLTSDSARDGRKFFTVGDIWKAIVKCARDNGDPGLIFIDRVNEDNPTPTLGRIEATNPCGEQPLLPYEACTLGSINLAKFVLADHKAKMDWDGLAETVKLSVRFLDNVIDACHYPVDEIAQMSHANRKIGLGVMGFADCLFMLEIPYDSKAAIELGRKIMKFINEQAQDASAELAKLKGSFPNWPASTWAAKHKKKVRNATITCVAPTGTLSIIADCSAGIEPVYSLVFMRQILEGRRLLQVNPIFKKAAEQIGIYTKELESAVNKSGTIKFMKAVPAKMRNVFKCAFDVSPQWHIRMQAAFQEHCDAAVSKTINFAANATISDVDKAYRLAFELGCKGITIYRSTSRKLEPMTLVEDSTAGCQCR